MTLQDELLVDLVITPFLKFLKRTVKNKKHKKELDAVLIEARDILLQLVPLKDEPAAMRRVKRGLKR